MKNIQIKKLIYLSAVVITLIAGHATVSPNIEAKSIKSQVKPVLVKKEIKTTQKIETIVETIKVVEEVKEVVVEVKATPVKKSESKINTNGFTIYSTEEIKTKICQVFVNNCNEALIIAFRESGYRQFAVSKTNDYGVFQMNCRWQKRRVGGNCNNFFDVDTNIRVAKQIYDEQGWNPWTTKKYLP
jgi:hypothetical protein